MLKSEDAVIEEFVAETDAGRQVAEVSAEINNHELWREAVEENFAFSTRSRIARAGNDAFPVRYKPSEEGWGDVLNATGILTVSDYEIKIFEDEIIGKLALENLWERTTNIEEEEKGPEIEFQKGDRIGRYFAFWDSQFIQEDKELEEICRGQNFHYLERNENGFRLDYPIRFPIHTLADNTLTHLDSITMKELSKMNKENILERNNRKTDSGGIIFGYTETENLGEVEADFILRISGHPLAHAFPMLIDSSYSDAIALELPWKLDSDLTYKVSTYGPYENLLRQSVGAYAVRPEIPENY